ncbi:MAG: 5'/3'-nucleotidase SurE [Flavobacteriales bacterium]|nr:5'/3'-nucleotidase SurE [Flavobacteriales bacterium]|tara:strand:+ start:118 stop:888 length:771 start_codon:yes stop_codon:yes gene_type:complete
MTQKPLILVANDDGISAPGLRALIKVLNEFGKVVVVAPDGPQSGMGHAITLNSALRCDKVHIDDGPQEEYSCSGTPVDCVKLAVNKILKRKPDLCISGINHGSNSSINVIYSGTMSAALEGAIEGIPSIGFSLLDYAHDADFSVSQEVVRKLVSHVLKEGLPEGSCLNVNIPKLPSKDIKGIRVCRQANANWIEEFDERKDPTGRTYYWLTGTFQNYDNGEDTDEWALANGYVSVVPVQYDVTAHHVIPLLKNWLL